MSFSAGTDWFRRRTHSSTHYSSGCHATPVKTGVLTLHSFAKHQQRHLISIAAASRRLLKLGWRAFLPYPRPTRYPSIATWQAAAAEQVSTTHAPNPALSRSAHFSCRGGRDAAGARGRGRLAAVPEQALENWLLAVTFRGQTLPPLRAWAVYFRALRRDLAAEKGRAGSILAGRAAVDWRPGSCGCGRGGIGPGLSCTARCCDFAPPPPTAAGSQCGSAARTSVAGVRRR